MNSNEVDFKFLRENRRFIDISYKSSTYGKIDQQMKRLIKGGRILGRRRIPFRYKVDRFVIDEPSDFFASPVLSKSLLAQVQLDSNETHSTQPLTFVNCVFLSFSEP